MKHKRNIVGNRYGNLTVISEAGKDKYNHYMSLVRCDCGKEYLVPDTELIYGRRLRCNACNKPWKTHGMSKNRMFFIWQSMRARCNNPNKQHYKHYGGRGIKVCDEWNKSFEAFRDWSLANGYKEDLSIDRIDVNGNYEPSNCRWATKLEQARNRRDNVLIKYEGNMLPITVVAEITGIKACTISARLHSGWSEYDATHDLDNHSIDALYKHQQRKRKEVDLIFPNGEGKHFKTMSEASKFLGYGVGYLTVKSKRCKSNRFTVGETIVVLSDHYITEKVNEEYIARK